MAKNDLVTKNYLDERLDSFKTELKTELKEELLQIKSDIVKEIRDLRDEFDVHQYSLIRINDELQDHDKRIQKLEIASKRNSHPKN